LKGDLHIKAYKDFSDERLRGGCTYCNQPATTRDHVPAKAFLDKPYPSNWHIVYACEECNNKLSKDEAYVEHHIRYITIFVRVEKNQVENVYPRIQMRLKNG